MAGQNVDAISSFQLVVDSVPKWKNQVNKLSSYAAVKHEESVAEYSRLLHRTKTRRKKSASVASLHSSQDEQQESEQPGTEPQSRSPALSELVELNPLEAGNRFIYAQAHRKRKPGTSIRSNASGPRAYRNKQMVVIYYDSHIQTELDNLVKEVGASRNNLRKGKNAYVASKGFALPGLSRRYETLDNLVPNMMSRSSPRFPKAQGDSTVFTTSTNATGETAFIRSDKELEQIQALCETAAHQVIRDGDCKTELRQTLDKLDVLQALAESTLDALKTEKEKSGNEETYATGTESGDDHSTRSTLYERSSIEALGLSGKGHPTRLDVLPTFKVPPISASTHVPGPLLATDTIEVDDDEEDESFDDLDLNVTSYRTAGRRLIT